ncbi:hypothetical protein BaRGS_00026795 [Batillaria attramentaria]|uniref:Uncharacterized protein n=1 Tax=Batillaria attramentaria TaxID=370345 RepID=A0ABD0K4K3_9CAEN
MRSHVYLQRTGENSFEEFSPLKEVSVFPATQNERTKGRKKSSRGGYGKANCVVKRSHVCVVRCQLPCEEKGILHSQSGAVYYLLPRTRSADTTPIRRSYLSQLPSGACSNF